MALTTQPNTITRREVHGYDDQSRLTSVSAPEGVIHYAYDPSTLEQGNAVVSDYQYDPLNRLTDLTHFVDSDGDAVKDAAEAVVANFHYVLNADGNKASATETDDQNRTRTFTWKYDALDRLTSEVMESSVDADYITRFTMDLVGNRLKQETDNDATAQAISAFSPTLPSSLTPDEVIDYSYDANDRLQWERNDAAGTAEDTYTTYAWNAGDQTGKTVRAGLDASGNVTEQTTFTYNVQGRTGSITIAKGGQTTVITYRYNPDGIRVEESTTAGGATTTKSYLIDQANLTGYAQVLEEYVNGQLAKTFTLGHDVLTQADATNGPLTLIYDGHGSTRALLDAAAAVIQRYAYEAYGQMLDGQGLTTLSAALTSLLYSGEMTDKLTGLQNLRDRLYDVNTGRFTQFDRYFGINSDPVSLHKYQYTGGNPISGVDPSGQMGIAEQAVTWGIIGILAATAGVTLYNAHRAAFAEPMSKDDLSETSRSWYAINSGASLAFMAGGFAISTNTFVGATSGKEVTGYTMALNLALPLAAVSNHLRRVPSRAINALDAVTNSGGAALLSGLEAVNVAGGVALNGMDAILQGPSGGLVWLASQRAAIRNALSGIRSAGANASSYVFSAMEKIASAVGNSASSFGGSLKTNANWGGGVFVGGGMFYSAPTPSYLTGFAAGASLSANARHLGGFLEGNVGLSLNGPDFLTGTWYSGAGLAAGLSASASASVNLTLSFFVPTNLYDWEFPNDI